MQRAIPKLKGMPRSPKGLRPSACTLSTKPAQPTPRRLWRVQQAIPKLKGMPRRFKGHRPAFGPPNLLGLRGEVVWNAAGSLEVNVFLCFLKFVEGDRKESLVYLCGALRRR